MASVNFFVYTPQDEDRLIAFEKEVKQAKNVDIREQLIKWEPVFPQKFHAPLLPFKNGMIVCCQLHGSKKVVGYISFGFDEVYFQDFSTKTACIRAMRVAERFQLTSMPQQLIQFAQDHCKKLGIERMIILRDKQDFDHANTLRSAKFDSACQLNEYIYPLSDRKANKKIKNDLPSSMLDKEDALKHTKTFYGHADLACEKYENLFENDCYKGTMIVEDDDQIVGISFWEYTKLATERVDRFVIPMRYFRHPVYKYLIYIALLVQLAGFVYLEYIFFKKAPIFAMPLLYVLYRILHVLFIQGSFYAFSRCFSYDGMRRIKLFAPFHINKKEGKKIEPVSESKYPEMMEVLIRHAGRHCHEEDYYTMFFKYNSESPAVEKLGKPRKEVNILQCSLEENITYKKYGEDKTVNTKNVRLSSCTNFVFIDPRYT